jgi:hypothetical protein
MPIGMQPQEQEHVFHGRMGGASGDARQLTQNCKVVFYTVGTQMRTDVPSVAPSSGRKQRMQYRVPEFDLSPCCISTPWRCIGEGASDLPDWDIRSISGVQ